MHRVMIIGGPNAGTVVEVTENILRAGFVQLAEPSEVSRHPYYAGVPKATFAYTEYRIERFCLNDGGPDLLIGLPPSLSPRRAFQMLCSGYVKSRREDI